MPRRWAVLLLGLMALSGVNGTSRAADGVTEAEITAAFLFNFARYTRWPEHHNRGEKSQRVFCFFDATELADVFERMVGSAARIRTSEVTRPLLTGTLRSSRIMTRLPARSRFSMRR